MSHPPVTLSGASLSDTILFASPPMDAWCGRDSSNRIDWVTKRPFGQDLRAFL